MNRFRQRQRRCAGVWRGRSTRSSSPPPPSWHWWERSRVFCCFCISFVHFFGRAGRRAQGELAVCRPVRFAARKRIVNSPLVMIYIGRIRVMIKKKKKSSGGLLQAPLLPSAQACPKIWSVPREWQKKEEGAWETKERAKQGRPLRADYAIRADAMKSGVGRNSGVPLAPTPSAPAPCSSCHSCTSSCDTTLTVSSSASSSTPCIVFHPSNCLCFSHTELYGLWWHGI